MMCEPCMAAGRANSKGLAKAAFVLHAMCDYPSTCTCQHGVGRGWINYGRAATAAISGT